MLPSACLTDSALCLQYVLKKVQLLQSDPEVIHGRCIGLVEPLASAARKIKSKPEDIEDLQSD